MSFEGNLHRIVNASTMGYALWTPFSGNMFGEAPELVHYIHPSKTAATRSELSELWSLLGQHLLPHCFDHAIVILASYDTIDQITLTTDPEDLTFVQFRQPYRTLCLPVLTSTEGQNLPVLLDGKRRLALYTNYLHPEIKFTLNHFKRLQSSIGGNTDKLSEAIFKARQFGWVARFINRELERIALKGLQDALKDPMATWTCIEQKLAVLAVLRREGDVCAILKKGTGEAMLAIIPGLVEVDSLAVLVLSSKSLVDDYCHMLSMMGIGFELFNYPEQHLSGAFNLILVSVDHARERYFQEALYKAHNNKKATRLFFYDAHTALLNAKFRPVFQQIHLLRNLPVQVILLSAFLPPQSHEALIKMFHLINPTTIRGSTDHSQLEYIFQNPYNRTTIIVEDVIAYVKGQLPLFTDKDRCLIFVSSKEAEGLPICRGLACNFYHGGSDITEEERHSYYTSWLAGFNKVIVCTKALFPGNHYPHIRPTILPTFSALKTDKILAGQALDAFAEDYQIARNQRSIYYELLDNRFFEIINNVFKETLGRYFEMFGLEKKHLNSSSWDQWESAQTVYINSLLRKIQIWITDRMVDFWENEKVTAILLAFYNKMQWLVEGELLAGWFYPEYETSTPFPCTAFATHLVEAMCGYEQSLIILLAAFEPLAHKLIQPVLQTDQTETYTTLLEALVLKFNPELSELKRKLQAHRFLGQIFTARNQALFAMAMQNGIGQNHLEIIPTYLSIDSLPASRKWCLDTLTTIVIKAVQFNGIENVPSNYWEKLKSSVSPILLKAAMTTTTHNWSKVVREAGTRQRVVAQDYALYFGIACGAAYTDEQPDSSSAPYFANPLVYRLLELLVIERRPFYHMQTWYCLGARPAQEEKMEEHLISANIDHPLSHQRLREISFINDFMKLVYNNAMKIDTLTMLVDPDGEECVRVPKRRLLEWLNDGLENVFKPELQNMAKAEFCYHYTNSVLPEDTEDILRGLNPYPDMRFEYTEDDECLYHSRHGLAEMRAERRGTFFVNFEERQNVTAIKTTVISNDKKRKNLDNNAKLWDQDKWTYATPKRAKVLVPDTPDQYPRSSM
ncbi:hypothetical protein H0H93_003106 [Arthromyces matolae]|nr:hypothetical protein H0H93_003106 [Arthromyces matolae]